MFAKLFTRLKALLPIEATLRNSLMLAVNAAVVLYASFWFMVLLRRWMLPAVAELTIPLNFAFSTCNVGPGGMCTFPTANATLLSDDGDPVFASGTHYALGIDVTLPDSELNREVGMFLSVLQLIGARGEVLSEMVRSADMPYRSTMVRYVRNLVLLPFILLGWRYEDQKVHIDFHRSYHDSPYVPAVYASVQLQHKRIQVQDAQLRIHAVFGFFRQWLYSWPITSSVCVFGFCLGSLTSVSLLYWSHKSARYVLDGLDRLDIQRRGKAINDRPNTPRSRNNLPGTVAERRRIPAERPMADTKKQR